MAGSLTLAIRTAQSGLLTNQAALNATANNIANVNSVGYSRKIVNMEQRVVESAGAGVQIADITRRIDENLLKSLRLEKSTLNALDVQENYYARLQELFGAPGDNTSLAHLVGEFEAAIESLADAPGKTLEQSELVRRANEMTLKLQSMSTTIQELRLQADQSIGTAVTEINVLTNKIADLNDKIISNETVGRDVTDLRDQRDQSLDRMAELIDIVYFSRSDGDIVVFSSGGRTLIDNAAVTMTHSAAGTIAATTTHAEGDLAGLFVGVQIAGNDITSELRGGQIKGLIDLRDNILTDLQSQLDEMAAELRDVFNQIHNRGVPFPGMQSMTGTRIFVDSSTQTIDLDPTSSADDVTISLFDSSGDQQATTTLNTIMQVAYGAGDSAAKVSYAAWTVDEVAAHIQGWLQANGAATATAAVNSSGKFAITLNNTSLNLVFRDETATAAGSTHQDAAIGFDPDGDGDVDETVSGFSYFLGLNDFFVDNLSENIYESNQLASSFGASAATLTFEDDTGALGNVSITAGTNLTGIATAINNATIGVTAAIIPDGAGFRLRISHGTAGNMTVTQGGVNTLLTELGMHGADVNVSGTIAVRNDILVAPGNVTRGSMQWNANLAAAGEYFMSVSDDTQIKNLASTFAAVNAFDAAGNIASLSHTFDEYAAAIVAHNATQAESNRANIEIQQLLTESLQFKSDTERGVNLDEEMSNLILFEQAYSAAARVISIIQSMFDALERAV
ncbi:MAG: flagellar hook-associated protein FlgK [Rhodospirillales bacterium]|jgi:flagellar hook-associated protein 1 FlgK|nr:flagellar hook-associated protein FlgK [Rhodospirillales bacterium]HIJ42968.1 flagellar hook-associated protein FlgK [Rhodospirillaceae bacterium]MDP7215397.1 flagellar hook-associated protein FlgK [Rhodospirillales bacterium]HIJ44855.1 flagellar hook-associated protein FlgK [Rhodospirillaceae bacterium]HIJ92131.1 flagellar hook-associated protein FlgK [Rhodospirillaceae bacterium]